MNKTLSLILALALALALGVPALAENETSGATEITTTISETYTITIPNNTAIAFNATSTDIGDIGLSVARLGPGRKVTFTADVTVAGLGELTHTNNTNKLAYTLKLDSAATNTISFTSVATKTVQVDITAAAWAAAPAGSYSDTITFTVACVDA